MRITCPNCQTILNLLDETLDHDSSCPTCGCKFAMNQLTVTYGQQSAGQVRNFVLLSETGRGQFGTVWRARDEKLGRTVAIKIPRRDKLNERVRKMFLREAKAAASLDHPHIVRVFESFEENGQVYIVSEFINGHTLQTCLSAERFSYRETAEFVAATALAVDYAHQRGVIHRDLKPGNILVDGGWQPHVTDFGLAKHSTGEVAKGATGNPMGTPPYMSPEQAAGEGEQVDRRSDVYSLGIILYEMLTGKRPFANCSDESPLSEVLNRIQTEEPLAPRLVDKHLPYDLEVICLKAISKAKEQRYATARELAEDLQRYLDGTPIRARSISLFERGSRWVRKNLTLAIVGLVALCTSLVSLNLIQQGPREPVTLAIPSAPPLVPLNVKIQTEPAGAEVILFPLDSVTGDPRDQEAIRPTGKSPMSADLMPGHYLVVAKMDDGRFHEVYRQVPETPEMMPMLFHRHRSWEKDGQGSVTLPLIRIPDSEVTRGMAEFPGAERFAAGRSGDADNEAQVRRVAPFYMDVHEVTIQEYRDQFGGEFAGNILPEHPEQGRLPMTGTLFDYAVDCLERMGKRLPTEFEYEFAATNGGTTRYPWGDNSHSIPWELSPVEEPAFDQTTSATKPVYGLLTNGAEFTCSKFPRNIAMQGKASAPHSRRSESSAKFPRLPDHPMFHLLAVRGGVCDLELQRAVNLEDAGARFRTSFSRERLNGRIGFRGVRSQSPRG